MTEQQKRSLFFNATGKVATINYFEYFIFCKGMDVEREACAKVAENGRFLHDASPEARFGKECAAAIRARGQE